MSKTEHMPPLAFEGLSIGYGKPPKACAVLENLNGHLAPGELVCLLGPNGAGKSTLLRTMAGLQPALAGQVTLGGTPVPALPRQELARRMGVVLTGRHAAGSLTVQELVALGRTPHTTWHGRLNPDDKARLAKVLQQTQLTELAPRAMHTLSDGQAQKAWIARALAQDTPVLLLDEPTVHLDIPNKVAIMALLRQLSRQTQKAILVSTHDLDLALQMADRLWLVHPGKGLSVGLPEVLAAEGHINAVFGQGNVYFDSEQGKIRLQQNPNTRAAIRFTVQGPSPWQYWTAHALERMGGTPMPNALLQVQVGHENGKPYWKWSGPQGNGQAQSLEALLTAIHPGNNTLLI